MENEGAKKKGKLICRENGFIEGLINVMRLRLESFSLVPRFLLSMSNYIRNLNMKIVKWKCLDHEERRGGFK